MDRDSTERSDSAGRAAGRPIWALAVLWFIAATVAVVGALGDGGPTGRLCLGGLAGAAFFAILALLVLLTRSARLSPLERFVGVAPLTLLLAGAGLYWTDYRLNETPDSWSEDESGVGTER